MTGVKKNIYQNLIEAVKQYPQIYMNGYNFQCDAWADIAIQIKCKSSSCQLGWRDILYNYAKLKNIIHENPTLESVLQSHPETKMYLDGTLNFLDPFIKQIPDSKLPAYIHQRYQWVQKFININKIDKNIKNSTIVTQEMVQALLSERTDDNCFDLGTIDMINLMKAVENTITQCIITLKNTKEQHLEGQHKKPLTIDKSLEEECGDITEQLDSNNYNDNIAFDPLNLDVVDKTENVSRSSDDDADSEYVNVTDNTLTMVSHNINIKESVLDSDCDNITISDIKSEDNDVDSINRTDIKIFFGDLAELVSNRLSLQKQNELRQRISLLVREMIENNESD